MNEGMNYLSKFTILCSEAEQLDLKVEYKRGKVSLLDPYDPIESFDSLEDLEKYLKDNKETLIAPMNRVAQHDDFHEVKEHFLNAISKERHVMCKPSVLIHNDNNSAKVDYIESFDLSPKNQDLLKAAINDDLADVTYGLNAIITELGLDEHRNSIWRTFLNM